MADFFRALAGIVLGDGDYDPGPLQECSQSSDRPPTPVQDWDERIHQLNDAAELLGVSNLSDIILRSVGEPGGDAWATVKRKLGPELSSKLLAAGQHVQDSIAVAKPWEEEWGQDEGEDRDQGSGVMAAQVLPAVAGLFKKLTGQKLVKGLWGEEYATQPCTGNGCELGQEKWGNLEGAGTWSRTGHVVPGSCAGRRVICKTEDEEGNAIRINGLLLGVGPKPTKSLGDRALKYGVV